MRRFVSCIVLTSCVATISIASSSADDWPQWRGPNRDGISREKGLLKAWPAGGPKLLWTARDLGDGFSTPSVVGDVLLTMGNRDGQEFVLALDVADSGKLLWATPLGAVRHGGSGYPGPRSTPTVDGAHVYALGLNGDLVCLDLKSGALIWRKDLVGEFGGVAPTWGYSESVLVDGPWVVCTPGGPTASIVALDKATGEKVWASPIGAEPAYASIVVGAFAGVKQYVQFMSPGVFGVAADVGTPLWRYDAPANDTANISTALVFNGLVFAASGYGTGGGAAVIENRGTIWAAAEKFFTHDMKNQHGGMVIVDGFLYGSSDPGALTCIDMKTGETKWQERAPGKCSLIYVDGQLITRSERSKVCLIDVNSTGATIVGEFQELEPSDKPSWPHPVVANGRLYLQDQDRLACYELTRSSVTK